MDLTQLIAKINWLDEERRKDKAEIAALQQRVIGAENEARETSKRILDLETRLAAAQVQLAKLPRVDDALDKMRTEIILMIEEHEDRRKAAEREAEKLRRVELEAQAKALAEFRRELAVIPRVQEEIPPIKAEQQRVTPILGALSHQIAQIDERIDERVRDVSYLEEARRQDNRRLTELQVELAEFRKRVEAYLPKVEVVEEQVVRNHARVAELVALETARKQDHSKFIEQYAMLARERDRRMETWSAEIAESLQRVEGYAKRVEAYAELQQVVTATLAQLEGLRQRLEQRQNEVGEMQRLAEDRIKQQWAEFAAEHDKKTKHQQITADERWRDHERRHSDIGTRLDELTAIDVQVKADLVRLWRLQDAHAQTMTVFSRQWLEDFEGSGDKSRTGS